MPALLRILASGLAFLLALMPCSASAQTSPGKRVALLVGNSRYAVGQLSNPGNDVREMETALKALGFQTRKVLDANQNQLKRAIRDFGSDAQGAAVALFYYSGHGTQAGGENYLIPVGATIEKEADYEVEAVSANGALRQIAGARPGVALVVLDACRDNPLASTKGGPKGLGRMDAPSGTAIAFATAPNATANDNGLFAKVLAAELRKAGQELFDAFRNTTAKVRQASGNKQEPRVSEWSITERVYLAGEPQESADKPTQSLPVQSEQVDSAAPQTLPSRLDLGELQRQAQAEELEMAPMLADFQQVEQFVGSPSLKIKAWEQFLIAWSPERMPGPAARELRAKAEKRRDIDRQSLGTEDRVALIVDQQNDGGLTWKGCPVLDMLKGRCSGFSEVVVNGFSVAAKVISRRLLALGLKPKQVIEGWQADLKSQQLVFIPQMADVDVTLKNNFLGCCDGYAAATYILRVERGGELYWSDSIKTKVDISSARDGYSTKVPQVMDEMAKNSFLELTSRYVYYTKQVDSK